MKRFREEEGVSTAVLKCSKHSTLSTPTASRPSRKTLALTDVAPVAPCYDFRELIRVDAELRERYATSGSTLDFRDREATLYLTRAILRHYFGLSLILPPGHLTPTVPNRVQYLQWAFSLLDSSSSSSVGGGGGWKESIFEDVKLLDVGTGPSCIYGILAVRLFPGCKVIATDIDDTAVSSACANVQMNGLTKNVTVIRMDRNGPMIPHGYSPSLTVSNPPFHDDVEENDEDEDDDDEQEVAAGTPTQMCTPGGEVAFIAGIARESVLQPSVHWFTSLIGCKASVSKVITMLRSAPVNATAVRSVRLCPGGRTVRWAVAWTFGKSMHSSATIDSDDDATTSYQQRPAPSAWRVNITVTPGRVFANQLKAPDMGAVVTVAMLQRGWRDVSTATTTGSNRIGYKHVPTVVIHLLSSEENAHVTAHVSGPRPNGTFGITVKTESRGRMTDDQFRKTCEQLVEDVPRQLDELSSS